jgi:phosphate transport system substrate-binding protein
MASYKNNDMAISPIVATLVLIVVAVIGAVAVGTILGTFSSDVSKQANANGASSAAQTEILVAGSTTIDPITQAAAKMYSAQNPGIKITSQAMGSGAGVQAVGNGVADIGAASEAIKSSWTTQFPNLKTYQIGEGAISVITNKGTPANSSVTGVSWTDLNAVYDPMNQAPTLTTLNAAPVIVTRADGSGTADSFYQKYLGLAATYTSSANETTVAVNGNAAVVSTVASTKNSVGFADYGDAVANVNGANTIIILPVMDKAGKTYSLQNFDGATGTQTTNNFNTLRSEAKYVYQGTVEGQSGLTDPAKYPSTLLRPLFYVTNGVPSSNVQSFINFVTAQPYDTNSKMNVFQETNNFCVADIA